MENLSDYSEDVQETLLMRARIAHQDKTNMTICIHHSKMFGLVFERRFNKCCNIFNSHKVKAKGGHVLPFILQSNLGRKGLMQYLAGNYAEIVCGRPQMRNKVLRL
jgi:hypothetical protein